jgi:hypothetical protein
MPDRSDEQGAVLERIASLQAEFDPVPSEVINAAKDSFTWRTLDAELAELIDDSALCATTGIRGDSSARLLTFTSPSLTVVLEVSAAGDRRRILGQVVRPDSARTYEAVVEIRHPQTTPGTGSAVRTDDYGRFTMESTAGPVHLDVRFDDDPERPLRTSWVIV